MVLDCTKGYWQVELCERDKENTAINMSSGTDIEVRSNIHIRKRVTLIT